MNKTNILLIGIGPHAKRIYLPLLELFNKDKNIILKAIVDIKEKQSEIEAYYSKAYGQMPRSYFIKPHLMTYDHLHEEVENTLDLIVEEQQIDAVIIATEPLTHIMYAVWALKKNLPILMDKPISTYIDVSTDIEQAQKFIVDFNILKKQYKHAKNKNPNMIFSIMAQRRFHNSYKIMQYHLNKCFKETNCPVTSINTFHSDGQWRTPAEMINQLYHSYFQGYGKCSHSGYHYFDIIPFLLSGAVDNKEKSYDSVEVFSKFVRPNDFMGQLTLDDHKKTLNKQKFLNHNPYTPKALDEKMAKFGEVDAFNTFTFKQGQKNLTAVSLNMTHNGVSHRNWSHVGDRDLYKGIGRIGHETHIIEQGPFQTIHFHSYKSKENETSLYNAGGEKHLEVIIYRNNRLLGGRHITRYSMEDFLNWEIEEKGLNSIAKTRCFLEFIDTVQGKNIQSSSDLLSHEPATILMSAAYQSAAAQFSGINLLINVPFSLNHLVNSKPSYDMFQSMEQDSWSSVCHI